MIVLRNIMDTKNNLALLEALGFSKTLIIRLILIENLPLFLAGLVCGLLSSLLALLPILTDSGAELPYGFLLLLTAAVLANGLIWIFVATLAATKGKLLPALRHE